MIHDRRRLLAAFALLAGLPGRALAQAARPDCVEVINLPDGSQLVAEQMIDSPTTMESYSAIAANTVRTTFGPPMLGDVRIAFVRSGTAIEPATLYVSAPFPDGGPALDRNIAILVNGKAYPISKSSAGSGRFNTELEVATLPAAERSVVRAALKNGGTVAIVLKQAAPGTKSLSMSRVLPPFGPRLSELAAMASRVDFKAKSGQCEPTEDCFLTTATVRAVGLADDCWELSTLRAFRDGPLAATPRGAGLIADYYVRAPRIVEAVDHRADAARVWLKVYFGGVLPCALAARLGLNRLALAMYRRMTIRLEALAAA